MGDLQNGPLRLSDASRAKNDVSALLFALGLQCPLLGLFFEGFQFVERGQVRQLHLHNLLQEFLQSHRRGSLICLVLPPCSLHLLQTPFLLCGRSALQRGLSQRHRRDLEGWLLLFATPCLFLRRSRPSAPFSRPWRQQTFLPGTASISLCGSDSWDSVLWLLPLDFGLFVLVIFFGFLCCEDVR